MEKEVLVFGKYKIGDLVASNASVLDIRVPGSVFEIQPNSNEECLSYLGNDEPTWKHIWSSTDNYTWRDPSEEEILLYKEEQIRKKQTPPHKVEIILNQEQLNVLCKIHEGIELELNFTDENIVVLFDIGLIYLIDNLLTISNTGVWFLSNYK